MGYKSTLCSWQYLQISSLQPTASYSLSMLETEVSMSWVRRWRKPIKIFVLGFIVPNVVIAEVTLKALQLCVVVVVLQTVRLQTFRGGQVKHIFNWKNRKYVFQGRYLELIINAMHHMFTGYNNCILCCPKEAYTVVLSTIHQQKLDNRTIASTQPGINPQPDGPQRNSGTLRSHHCALSASVHCNCIHGHLP